MRWLAWVSLLVPSHRRESWLEEWRAELWQIEHATAPRPPSATGGEPPVERDPRTRSSFLLGALPHALWERLESWKMTGSMNDLRLAIRSLVRNPGWTTVAVLSLGLGLGVGSVVLTLIDGLLFSDPVGVQAPDRLVQLGRTYDDDPRFDSFSFPNYRILDEETTALTGVAGYFSSSVLLGSGVEATPVSAELVTSGYFDLLGTEAAIGRTFRGSDADPGSLPRSAVLSHGLWSTRFGSDPSIVGAPVVVNGFSYEVVGVLPKGFAGIETLSSVPGIYLPAGRTPEIEAGFFPEAWVGYDRSWLSLFGRLADGSTLETARAEMGTIARTVQDAHSNNEGTLVAVAEGVGLDPEERGEAKTAALLLLGIALVVLLITCSNLSSLLLARGDARRGEVGVRVALGAGRGRLARQFLTEGVVLAGLGGTVAFGLAWYSSRFLASLLPWSVSTDLTPGPAVFFATLVTALAAGIVFGAVPLLSGAGGSIRPRERSESRTARCVQNILTVVQVALALALVSGGSLLARSLLLSRSADPGFGYTDLWVASINLGPSTGYTEESGRAFLDERLRELRALSEVESASIMTSLPISSGQRNQSFVPEGMPDPERPLIADVFSVGPDFFNTLSIPVVSGRTVGDDLLLPNAEPELVVNRAFVEQYVPEGNAVGMRIGTGPEGLLYRIVGVVADVRHRSIREEARPTMYVPLSQDYSESVQFVARIRGGDEGRFAAGALSARSTLASADPDVPVQRVWTGREMVDATMRDTRTLSYMVLVASVLSLFLAAVGLHGVIAFRVARRKREMGIRIAVGAGRSDVIGGVLRGGLLLLAPGIVIGLALSIGLGRTLESLLFGTAPWDPMLTLLNVGVLGAAALLALVGPAMDSTRVDVVQVLRQD